MKLNFNSILLSTEDKARLVKFYSEVFEKKPDMEEDTYAGFSAGACFLTVGFHDKIKGGSPNPDRILFNFQADDVKGEFERVKNIEGAKVIQEPYEPGEGYWIATLADPDGNYFQIVSAWDEVEPEKEKHEHTVN